MRKRVSIIIMVVVLATLLGCPASQAPNVVQTAEMTKTVAEDVLYYARVYYNLGKINQAQFDSVVKAYDTLREAQNLMIDARVAYLATPKDATAEQKYRATMTAVLNSMQSLISLSNSLGLSNPSVSVPVIK